MKKGNRETIKLTFLVVLIEIAVSLIWHGFVTSSTVVFFFGFDGLERLIEWLWQSSLLSLNK